MVSNYVKDEIVSSIKYFNIPVFFLNEYNLKEEPIVIVMYYQEPLFIQRYIRQGATSA